VFEGDASGKSIGIAAPFSGVLLSGSGHKGLLEGFSSCLLENLAR